MTSPPDDNGEWAPAEIILDDSEIRKLRERLVAIEANDDDQPPVTLADALTAYRRQRADKDMSLRGFALYLHDKGLSGKPGFEPRHHGPAWTNAGLPPSKGGRGRRG